MPIVVIGRRDICPSATGQFPEKAYAQDELGKCGIRSCSEEIEEENENKSGTGGDSYEDLEDCTFGIAITDCR